VGDAPGVSRGMVGKGLSVRNCGVRFLRPRPCTWRDHSSDPKYCVLAMSDNDALGEGFEYIEEEEDDHLLWLPSPFILHILNSSCAVSETFAPLQYPLFALVL
jgi:hypothetical protein